MCLTVEPGIYFIDHVRPTPPQSTLLNCDFIIYRWPYIRLYYTTPPSLNPSSCSTRLWKIKPSPASSTMMCWRGSGTSEGWGTETDLNTVVWWNCCSHHVHVHPVDDSTPLPLFQSAQKLSFLHGVQHDVMKSALERFNCLCILLPLGYILAPHTNFIQQPSDAGQW